MVDGKKKFGIIMTRLDRRTNNDLEGFNRQLNRFLSGTEPNIYTNKKKIKFSLLYE
jgi:hypothetical protein